MVSNLVPMSIEKKINKKELEQIFKKLEDSGILICPQSVAQELAIPKNLIYEKPELLDLIYKNAFQVVGADALIQKLLRETKSLKTKLEKVENDLEEIKNSEEKKYSEAFLKGASINYQSSLPEKQKQITLKKKKELWARGVLHFDIEVNLSEKLIKSAFRKMISIIHPDKSGKNTEAEIEKLQKAQKILLECLRV
jgi:hypothetical protein